MGHKITLTRADGETETLGRYPSHDAAKRHVADYCRWDDGDWTIDDNYQRVESEGGETLNITPAPIYTRYAPANIEPDPRSGWHDWHGAERVELESLDLLTADGVLSVVLPSSDLDAYLDEHEREEISPPEYYSRFPDDDGERLIEGPPRDDYDGTTVTAGQVEDAIRMLNGSGRYPASEHVLHDCLPMPSIVERDGHGAAALPPQLFVSDDG